MDSSGRDNMAFRAFINSKIGQSSAPASVTVFFKPNTGGFSQGVWQYVEHDMLGVFVQATDDSGNQYFFPWGIIAAIM